MAVTEEGLQKTDSTKELPLGAGPSRRGSVLQRESRPEAAKTRWRRILAAAWIVLLPAAIALEPAAAVDEPITWWGELIAVGFLGALISTAVGLGRRRAWAPGASLLAASTFAAGVFACPATGHHAFGLWWIGEFGLAMLLVALSTAAYLRTR